jgi:hypothetical protein
MIAFGCSITSPEAYERFAGPGIRLAAEPDSRVFAHSAAGTIFRSYNLILEQVAALADLEALVLLHQDAEIVGADFCAQLRRALSEPDVAVVGCVGAAGVRSIAWWEGAVTRRGQVDVLDGFVLALAPWTVRNLRFDESVGTRVRGHELDLCLQARAAGHKVLAADLPVVHRHSEVLVTRPESWMEDHMAVAERWDADERDWKARARRAEAQAGAARLEGASKLLQAYARAEEQERELAALTDTLSWRLTEPLRRLNAARRALLRRQA